MGCHGDDLDVFQSELRHGLSIASNDGLERLPGFPLRMLRRKFPHPVKRKQHLGIDGLFDPGCSVLIEGGDALFWRYELRVVLVGRGFDKVEYRLLRRPVVP
jgi:hypothetical protein